MRYYIIFGITIVFSLLIIFCTPYLGTYKNRMTIEYDNVKDGYSWTYKEKGNALKIIEKSENKWIFKPNKTGIYEITYYLKKDQEEESKIYYKFFVINKRIFWLEGNAKGLLNYPNPY